MQRLIYRAQLKEGCEEDGLLRMVALAADIRKHVDDGELMTAAGFKWRNQIFLYFEVIRGEIHPDQWFGGMSELLENWPGESSFRKWIPMVDVFHFNEPVSVEHWRRKEPPERIAGRVAFLKPEMVASYIYYHYQLQEERAFHGPKYEIIAIHENLMFGYQEFPAVVEEPLAPKKLQTEGTPKDWKESRMDLHFQPWEDGHLYFKHIDTVFTYYG